MTDLWTTLLRTVLMYFIVFAVMRLMGKREIGKLSVFDLVISIMIAEIAVFIIEDLNKSLLEGMVPLFVLVIIQITFAFIMLKSEKLRRWFDGKPSIMIKDGRLNRTEMKKQKYNLDDLMLQLRMKDIVDVKEVAFAILETNGSLSVVKKQDLNPAQSNNGYQGLPLSLILDGEIQHNNLRSIQQSEQWLQTELRAQGVKRIKDVFFCNIDEQGTLFIARQEDTF